MLTTITVEVKVKVKVNVLQFSCLRANLMRLSAMGKKLHHAD